MSIDNDFGISPATVASMIPFWLEMEAGYANRKYGNKNPQKQSLGGALADPTSAAYQEIHNYNQRFWMNYNAANGNEHLLLKASQALGKLIGTSRALLRVVYEESMGLSRDAADVETFISIEERLGFSINSSGPIEPARQLENVDVVIGPAIEDIDHYITANDYPAAQQRTLGLIVSQSQLFVDFVCETGVIAVPGLDSSDVNSELDTWYLGQNNMVD